MSFAGRVLARIRGISLEPTDQEIRRALRAVSFAQYPELFLRDVENVERAGKFMTVFEVLTTEPRQHILVVHSHEAPSMSEIRKAFLDPNATLINFFEPPSE